MSETIPGTPVELSQDIVQIPYFLDPELQRQALTSPSALDPDVIGERQLVHTAALRLIATERLHERQRAWETYIQSLPTGQEPQRRSEWSANWREGWQLTQERRQRIMDRHQLQVRRIGRQLMRLQNEGRFDGNGLPLDPSVELVPANDMLSGYEVEPETVAAHLHRAGYQNQTTAYYIVRRVARQDMEPYPADARTYLASFPPVRRRSPDEHGPRTVAAMLNTSDGTLEGLALEHDIFPVVRLDDAAREQEYYIPEDIERLREIINRIPYINLDVEMRVSELYETYGRSVVDIALADAPVSTFLRRQSSGRPGRCVSRDQLSQVEVRLEYLTTLQEGEMGYEELAVALEITRSAAQDVATVADRTKGRLLHSPPDPQGRRRRVRTVFPAHVAAEMIRRRRDFLTPDLIPEIAMVARYPELVKSQRVSHILRRLDTEPVRLRLAGSSRMKRCRPWSVLQELDVQLGVPDDAVRIIWEDLPRDQLDTDPAHIAYARELQALLSSPKHVDPIPISVWIAQLEERLGVFRQAAPPDSSLLLPIVSRIAGATANAGEVRARSEASPSPRRSRAAPPAAPAMDEPAPAPPQPAPEPTPLPVIRAQPAFPAGERPYGRYGPARAPMSPEMVARYAPPRYNILTPPSEVTRRNGSSRLSAADISEITGASAAVVRSAVAARQNMFKTPAREVRRGTIMDCYEGPQLDFILIDLVGLTAQQMARRLDLPEAEVVAHLRQSPARANAQGRYSSAMWERLRVDFRLPPAGQWPVTEVIHDMGEDQIIALANSLGVTVTSYYIRGQGHHAHVSNGGAKLLQAQFSHYYADDARPYPAPSFDWFNRYEIAGMAGCTPEKVDAWMAPQLQTSRDMEWAQVRDERLRHRDIRVLPHYSNNLCDRFLRVVRTGRL